MAANTSNYKTGRLGVLTIAGTTFAKAKMVEEPAGQAEVVRIRHMGGFQKEPDGKTDFGTFRALVAEDGSARLEDTTVAVNFLYNGGGGWGCGSVYITSDGKAKAERGSSADREIVGELLSDAGRS